MKATLLQKATLSCEVADIKTEVKWYKDGKLLTSSKTIHAESKGKSRQLVIDSVEKKDAGEYICEAGTEKLSFKIQVAGKRNEILLVFLEICKCELNWSFCFVALCVVQYGLKALGCVHAFQVDRYVLHIFYLLRRSPSWLL